MSSSAVSSPDDGESGNTANRAPSPQTDEGSAPDQLANDSNKPTTNTRLCTICLTEEPEDNLPADWTTPCRCSVQGHHECLLTWLANWEEQGKSLSCPVCKSPILMQDRRDLAVEIANGLGRYSKRLSPLILFSFVSFGAFVASTWYGTHAVGIFAGPDALLDYLTSSNNKQTLRAAPTAGFWGKWRGANSGQADKWKLFTESPSFPNPLRLSSLSLIGPALILNRFNLGETYTIPTTFVYGMVFGDRDMFSWPPSPQRILTLYPAIKAVYFNAYHSLSRQIDRRIQALAANARRLPLAPESDGHDRANIPQQDGGEQQPNNVAGPAIPEQAPPPENGERVFEIQIEAQFEEDNEADQPAPNNAAPAAHLQINNQNVDGLVTSIVNHFAMTLLLPSISYGMGHLLRQVLPKHWVYPDPLRPRALLHERWGRSLVGGCLFVVLKDAFSLFIKYRRGLSRSYRRIQNAPPRQQHGN